MAFYSISELRIVSLLVLQCLVLGLQNSTAQLVQTLEGELGFGSSLVQLNDQLIVSAASASIFGSRTGALYVFRKINGRYEEVQLLGASNGRSEDSFGSTLIVADGDIVVGSHGYDDIPFENSGAVYVFRHDGSSWSESQIILPSTPNKNLLFGRTLASSGTTLFVGSVEGVFIYKKIDQAWVFDLFQENSAFRSSGGGFKFSNEQLFVGHENFNDVSVFDFDGTSFGNEVRIQSPEGFGAGAFGQGLDVCDDLLVVWDNRASIDELREGAVYIFRKVGPEWEYEWRLRPPSPNTDGNYGHSVVCAGEEAETITVTEFPNRSNIKNYIYRRIDNNWTLVAELTAPDLGIVVRMNAEYLFVTIDSKLLIYSLAQLTSVRATPIVSSEIRLGVLFPNPLQETAKVSYTLTQPSNLQLEVFDAIGKRVLIIDSGYKAIGEHEVTFDAMGLSAGIYFFTLTAKNFSRTRKMVVMR